ncbi:GNAT family N-acetyltransferase [Bacillus sp. JCM 19034]|uniref:GNAT family N-acetyltransferase n=1 Tax=Bacillus sp. JCM 19034 TaxID=1481928 RepID=UPI000783C606|nr:GNAT family N-acetyltransferase [Bacillus sp. JCM 19034]
MKIRQATEYEQARIKELAAKVQEEATVGYLPADHHMLTNGFGPCEYWVIDHNQICGWIVFGETIAPFKHVRSGMIFELFVLPTSRNKGYGSLLMSFAIEELRQRGYETVHLNVFANNQAKNLYNRMGFKEVSTIMEMELS